MHKVKSQLKYGETSCRIGWRISDACYERDEEEVLGILKNKDGFRAAMECRDSLGWSVPHQASERGLQSVLEEVISHEQGREGCSSARRTPAGGPPCTSPGGAGQSLVRTEEGRATIGQRESHGETPLHFAARQGNGDVVRILLGTKEGEKAATVRNNNGKTPRDEAERMGHTSTVALFCGPRQGDFNK